MTNKIIIGKPTTKIYGPEYPVKFLRNGKIVHSTIVFGNDLRYINQAYTADFNNIKPIRTYKTGKKRK